jgi:endonuclease/exonuclease/phosphatase (EEP) superfamily protein YafD
VYEEYLDSLGDFIKQRSPRPVLVAGDFNAKSKAWGCPGKNRYGRVLGL